MTFQQLIYVVEIARCGSINRAAQKLFVSQSSVSSALSELEEEFQIVLFKRSNTGAVLTEDGRGFLTYAKSILDRKEDLESLYSGCRTHPRTSFSISTQHYQCASAAFTNFLNLMYCEGYRLTYRECSMDRVIDDVYSFRSELGLIITSNVTEALTSYYMDKRDLSFQVITEIQPCVFLSKSHPLALRPTLRTEDIEDYPYVTFSHNQEMPIDFSEGISKLSLRSPKRLVETNDRCAMINLLCNSNSVSTGSGLLVEEMSDNRLISIPLEGSGESMAFGYIRRQDKPLGREAKSFLEELSKVVEHSKCYTKSIWEKKWPTAD